MCVLQGAGDCVHARVSTCMCVHDYVCIHAYLHVNIIYSAKYIHMLLTVSENRPQDIQQSPIQEFY